MRMLSVAAAAAFLILAISPALAHGSMGEPHPGGERPGGGCGSCGGGHSGGGTINVNVNASANANANAFAGASARSFLNARTYSVSGARSAVGGGTVYVGGGYGGDAGGSWGGPVYYNEAVYEGRACGAAPFGYGLAGFGRNERYAPVCGGGGHEHQRDRGGRYGYSERHDRYEERRHQESRYESREAYAVYEARTAYAAEVDQGRRDERYDERGHRDDATSAVEYDRGYMAGRRDCDCRADGGDGEPYGSWPEPVHQVPMTPNQHYGIGGETPQPPRQHYSQEPGERG